MTTTQSGDQLAWLELDELVHYAHKSGFPCDTEHLLAMALRYEAPSSLLWRLSTLPAGHQFASLEELQSVLLAETPT